MGSPSTISNSLPTMTPTHLLLLLLLHAPLSSAQSPSGRRIQTTFTYLLSTDNPPTAETPSCPSTITHKLILTYTGLNPQNLSEPLDGILWRDLSLNGVTCTPTFPRPEFTTRFLPSNPSPPTTPSSQANPWFLTGLDNSPRRCNPFQAARPARYFFTDDLPRFKDRFINDGLIPDSGTLPDPVTNPLRGNIYMFSRQFSPNGIASPTVCLYRAVPTPIPTPSGPTPTPQPACFPPHARAVTSDGRPVRMDMLAIGDFVQVGPDGKMSAIVSFSHQDADASALFTVVRLVGGTRNNTVLTATPGHLVRGADGRLVAVGMLRVGDGVRLADGGVGVVGWVGSTVGDGVYSPVTAHGDIVVDGVVASCYTTAVWAGVAHALLVPVRALFGVFVGMGKRPIEWVGFVDFLRVLMNDVLLVG